MFLVFVNPEALDKSKGLCYGEDMNDYELSKLAEMLDEDAATLADYDLEELLESLPQEERESFKEKYLRYYDDIKTSRYDDW